MQVDINKVTQAAVIVIVGGIVLLAITFLVEFLLPLLALAVLIILGYLIYKKVTTGTFGI